MKKTNSLKRILYVFSVIMSISLLQQHGACADKKKKPAQVTKSVKPSAPAEHKPDEAPKQKSSIASPLGNFDKSNDPTYIESATLTLRSQDRTFSYSGGVKVTRGDLTLTALELEGSYTEQNEIKTLTALKNVVIIKGDSIHATGGRAVYDAATSIVTLTENPQVTQGESQLLADLIRIYVNEDRSEAEGNVRMKVVKEQNTPVPAATSIPATKP